MYVATGSYDNTVKLWEIESGLCSATFEGHIAAISCVVFTPCGGLLISGSCDKTCMMWQLDRVSKRDRCVATFYGHLEGVLDVCVSQDGSLAATASSDRTCRIWHLAS